MTDFNNVVSQFRINGIVESVSPIGNGLINETLRVSTIGKDTPDYILQRINDAIFTDVELLQHNIELVTNHIREKLVEQGEKDIERKCLQFVKTTDGRTYYQDAYGRYWRMSVFIPDSITKEEVNPDSAFCCGETFGNFEKMLVDLKEPLGEVIPDFHNMELRMRQLQAAVSADVKGRASSVQDIIDELYRHADEMCLAERLYREGVLPKRTCHCDTKVNNMLFDESGKVLCVIDLDTVMPSFVFSDYGDFLRTSANNVAEDSDNYQAVGFKEDIFKSFTEGYLSSAGSFLTEVEMSHLPFAVALFPFMQCSRFLADYLNGDVYFKTKYAEHNLVRSRNQLLLYRDVRKHDQMMADFVQKTLRQ
ncbi:mucin-desulfating sulfatase [Prevotella sp. oral taxon 306 str. F0472]|uniref:phosphotransferase enzyme family protein n=1 Tax=Prevotella sp. oral taxon 306 TaxID=712461 RepID=UPI00025BB6F5|nr:aminoglycoside phosphotransferase family protein [Prevotella sp. oral taxon 306]EID33906.1 mucin-desulfating sulfatase [Prevotella sp. oral taxon 306 str. F0472]